MSYRYILRYYIDPGFHEEERIRELVEFCRDSLVEEVMFFYNPEELFQGYPAEEVLVRWIELAVKVRDALAAAGVAMSVNPWTTTVHLARGRSLPERMKSWQMIVGETGTVSKISSCPLSPEWQREIADWFARIAREVRPVAIWIEDDWRLHNHEADMNYGGCFCPLHLARFSARIGRPVGREELLEEMLDHDNLLWRRYWLDVSRESLLEPARVIEETVHAAASEVRLGLMSSVPDVQAVEGRDWQALQEAFSPGAPILYRPHLPPYTETRALTEFPAVTRQSVAEFTPGSVEIYPELENSPRCGQYSKSAAFSSFEMLSSPLYGASGITINHFDMMGNGTALDRSFGPMLRARKPRLNALAEQGATEANAEGVDVLFSPEVAAHMRSRSADSLFGIVNRSLGWSRTLGILGISQRLTARFDATRLTAVSDQTLRAYSDGEIRTMLRGKLLLDATSIDILVERGFGAEIGVKSCRWRTLDEAGFAYETIAATGERMSAQRCALRFLEGEAGGGAELSTIMRYDRTRLGPGLYRFENTLGGVIISCFYPLEEGQFFMGFFNSFRREFMQRTVLENAPETPMLCGRERPFHVYRNRLPDGNVLLSLINATLDVAPEVRFFATGVDAEQAEILRPDGCWEPVVPACCGEGNRLLAESVPALEGVYLRMLGSIGTEQ